MCLQGKLPLNMITLTTPCQDIKPNTFMIEGVLESLESFFITGSLDKDLIRVL